MLINYVRCYEMQDTIKVVDWAGDVVELKRQDYIRKFEDKLDFLDLFKIDEGTSEEREGAIYYVESKTEKTMENIRQLVRNLAYDNFYKIHDAKD